MLAISKGRKIRILALKEAGVIAENKKIGGLDPHERKLN